MRHQKKRHKLGRTAAHRKATLAALGGALIEHKRIETTLPKAKALRGFIEPLITRAKDDSTHSRRQAFRHLRSKEAVKELFGDVAVSVGDRPGGYTRIVKLGQRQGDNAEMAVIELVDYNDVQPEGTTSRKRRTRRSSGRSRRRSGGEQQAPAAATAPAPAEVETPETTEEPTEAPAPAAADPSGSATAGAPDEAVEDAEINPDGDVKAEGAVPPEVAQTHPEGATDHPDAEQGAEPGTGEPPPEAKQETQGRGGEHRG